MVGWVCKEAPMTSRVCTIVLGVLLSLSALPGCTTSGNQGASTDTAGRVAAPGPGMWKTSDLVIQYRQQARDLRDMARRLEMEAMLAVQRQDQERAQHTRDLAKEAYSAADTAEQQAREYQRQLPHGQVY